MGFYTFTFWQEEVQRCFTVFYPLERVVDEVPEQLAVVFSPHCYSKDKLNGALSMTNPNKADNKAAARYGYVRVAVSTPFKNWEFGFVDFIILPAISWHLRNLFRYSFPLDVMVFPMILIQCHVQMKIAQI